MPAYRDGCHTVLQDFISSRLAPNKQFIIPPVSLNFVEKQLQLLDNGNAVGLDGISPKLLCLGASTITQSLTYMFNLSIKNGIYLNIWKTAKITPIHNKSSLQDKGNFRPISILPTMSKILERDVHTAFYRYLNDNHLLDHAQSGFRHLHSCETVLANIMNK